MHLRQLTTIDEFRAVWKLEHEVWGYTTSEDAVPIPMLVVTAKIGGLVLGSFDDDDRMIGFAYCLPGVRAGRPYQWSHMLGVAATHRGRGVGRCLKLEQRRLALEAGFDLIEWTYDPLQAANAHLNFAKLAVLVRRYEEDVYGESSSPLHRGTATDRFIAEWWLRSSRVEARLQGKKPDARAHAEAVNRVQAAGPWLSPAGHDLSLVAPRLAVVIPAGFTEMQIQEPSLAREWRWATREVFGAYLGRGYEVVDFVLDPARQGGTYVLERKADE